MSTNFYINSSLPVGYTTYPKPKYVSPTLSSTSDYIRVAASASVNQTYLHPFYVPAGAGIYEIYSLSFTSVKQNSGTRNVKAVIYQVDYYNPYSINLIRRGLTATTISSANGWHTVTVSLQDVNGDPVTLINNNPFVGNQGAIYLIGFQTDSVSDGTNGFLDIRHVSESVTVDEDDNIQTVMYNSKADTFNIYNELENPSGTVIDTPDASEKDMHISLVGFGPPANPLIGSNTRGDKSITWNFTTPGYTDGYTGAYYLVNTSSTATKAAIGTTNNAGANATSFSGTNLTPGTTYYGHLYLSNIYGESDAVDTSGRQAIGIPVLSSVNVDRLNGPSGNQFRLTINFNNSSSTVTSISITPTAESATILSGSQITSQTSVIVDITTLWNKTTNQFTVFATNAVGNSNSITTVNYAVGAEPQIPNSVTSMNVTPLAFTPSTINITWSNPGVPVGAEAITGFTVQRSSASKEWNGSAWVFTSNNNWSTISGSLSPTTVAYTDLTCSPYTAYAYRILTTNNTGTSTGVTVGGLSDGGRVLIRGASSFNIPIYIEDASSGAPLRTYRYTNDGANGWEPTPY